MSLPGTFGGMKPLHRFDRALNRSVVVNGGLPWICRRITLGQVGESGLEAIERHAKTCDVRQVLIYDFLRPWNPPETRRQVLVKSVKCLNTSYLRGVQPRRGSSFPPGQL